ncbi:hypothetical protein [Pedobacter sp.]
MRALNTTRGIRMAKEMGYPNKAPLGYVKMEGTNGKKYIKPGLYPKTISWNGKFGTEKTGAITELYSTSTFLIQPIGYTFIYYFNYIYHIF